MEKTESKVICIEEIENSDVKFSNNENENGENIIDNQNELIINEDNVFEEKKTILSDDYYEIIKNFFKKRVYFFQINIEDLISIENNIIKLDVKKTIKFLSKDRENIYYPLALIENFVTIENEQTLIFNKKKYKDSDFIIIDDKEKSLICDTNIIDDKNLKAFCNLINSIVNKNSLENNENFDEFNHNIGLKDGILYSDNYKNVNSKILELEPYNLLICFDEVNETQRYFIRAKENWWCNVNNFNNLNYVKVKTLNFKP